MKRKYELASAILAVISGAIAIVIAAMFVVVAGCFAAGIFNEAMSEIRLELMYEFPELDWAFLLSDRLPKVAAVIMVVVAACAVGMGVASIIVGALLIKDKVSERAHKGLAIALVVIMGVYTVFGGFVFLPVVSLGLMIASFCVGNKRKQPKPLYPPYAPTAYPPASDGLAQKVAELKRVYEMGALTEEQYHAAVNELTARFVASAQPETASAPIAEQEQSPQVKE